MGHVTEYSAVVQIPAYREPDIARTLDALTDQVVPVGWTISREVWVTPDNHDNLTLRVAREHPEFTVFEAPQGKLAARNEAHNHAVNNDYDVFVTWDADVQPSTENTLASLLRPFVCPDVVAVNSRPLARDGGPIGFLGNFLAVGRRIIKPHLHGQASAIRSSAWSAVGPFDTSIDQTSIHDVWAVEEVGLYRDLVTYGEIPKPTDAVVWSSARRTVCHVQKAFDQAFWTSYSGDWCQSRGQETFRPGH